MNEIYIFNENYFEVENRIFVAEEIKLKENDFVSGNRKDEKVTFVFYNTEKDRTKERVFDNYQYALNVAREKTSDKRCKNFEYYIKTL